MHLDPECSARQTPSRICRHHGYIGTAGKIAPVIMKLRPLLQRRGLGGGGMHLDPERSARQTPSRICRHHGYIDPAGKIAPVIMKLRPLLQIQWPAPPPPRAGRTARRFGAPLTPRLARRPLCGEPLLPPTFRRRVAGVPPVRRGALRWTDSVSRHFQFQSQNITKFRPPWRIKGGKLKVY